MKELLERNIVNIYAYISKDKADIKTSALRLNGVNTDLFINNGRKFSLDTRDKTIRGKDKCLRKHGVDFYDKNGVGNHFFTEQELSLLQKEKLNLIEYFAPYMIYVDYFAKEWKGKFVAVLNNEVITKEDGNKYISRNKSTYPPLVKGGIWSDYKTNYISSFCCTAFHSSVKVKDLKSSVQKEILKVFKQK